MKSIYVLSLSLALGVGAGTGASTCSAQSAPRELNATCARSYTPARGSATRKQIADAMRRNLGASTGIYAVFVFDWLKVNGNWAYAETQPESADGSSKYEPVSALLRRKNGLWSVAERIQGDDETDPAQELKRVRKRFPSAPRDIFPR